MFPNELYNPNVKCEATNLTRDDDSSPPPLRHNLKGHPFEIEHSKVENSRLGVFCLFIGDTGLCDIPHGFTFCLLLMDQLLTIDGPADLNA